MSSKKIGSFSKFPRWGLQTFVVIVLLLVIARILLPFFVLRYVNRVLNQLPEYSGHVEDVDIALIRGAYIIKDFTLVKRSGTVGQPFLKMPATDLSVEWRALFGGELVGEIEAESPVLNLINASNPSQTQLSSKGDWKEVVKQLFPLKINRFTIANGTATYKEEGPKNEPALSISSINGAVSGLSNKIDSTKILPAPLKFSAVLQKYAQVKVNGKLNPLREQPTFDVNLSLAPLPLERLNVLLRSHAYVDAQGGTFELYGEVACKDGHFIGYMKPILKDVKIFSLSKDAPNPFALVWEGIVGLVTEVFTNQRHNQFASKIPIEGTISDPQISISSALWEIVKNAYERALKTKVDDSIDITEVK